MTKEDAKRTLQDMWECLFNEMTNHTFEDLKEHGMLDNYSKAFEMALSALSENKEIKEPTLLESFKDGADKVVEIWAVKGKLQIRTHGVIHNCNGIFGNDISVKSVNGSISAEIKRNTAEWEIDGHHLKCPICGEYFCRTDAEQCTIPCNFCPNCGADMRGKSCNTYKNSKVEFCW